MKRSKTLRYWFISKLFTKSEKFLLHAAVRGEVRMLEEANVKTQCHRQERIEDIQDLESMKPIFHTPNSYENE